MTAPDHTLHAVQKSLDTGGIHTCWDGPYQVRYERIKVEHRRAVTTGKLGRSVVYSRDPYAVE